MSGYTKRNLLKDVEVAQWDAVRVSPEITRSVEAGPEGLELIAFGAPNTGMQDVNQEMGWWSETD